MPWLHVAFRRSPCAFGAGVAGAVRETSERMLAKVILVPTDFSEASEGALDYAIELAARLDARVHVLHVVDISGFGGELGFALTSEMVADIRTSTQTALDKLVAARSARVAMAPARVELGDARVQIEAEAKRIGADLIIMATHGRRGVKRLLIGSVAESIARIAPCPVLLLRGVES
jgi:universal stress protein A